MYLCLSVICIWWSLAMMTSPQMSSLGPCITSKLVPGRETSEHNPRSKILSLIFWHFFCNFLRLLLGCMFLVQRMGCITLDCQRHHHLASSKSPEYFQHHHRCHKRHHGNKILLHHYFQTALIWPEAAKQIARCWLKTWTSVLARRISPAQVQILPQTERATDIHKQMHK